MADTANGIARTVSGGFALTMASQGGRFAITLGTTVTLARVLGPEAYGLTAMVAAVCGVLAVLNNVGVAPATIQKSEVDAAEVNSVYWTQAAASLGVGILGVSTAPFLARLYDDGRVAGVAATLSLAFFLVGMNYVPRALMRREFRYAALAYIDLASVGVGALAAVAAALGGAGYWALVLQPNVMAAFDLLAVFALGSWRPGRPRIDRTVLPYLAFGGPFLAHKLLEYVSRQIDKPLLAFFFGAQVLGLYDRAQALSTTPMGQFVTPLTLVLMPVLSRLRARTHDYNRVFLRALNAVAWVSAPTSALLAVCADDVVYVALGPKWDEAGPLLRYVAVGAPFAALGTSANWLFLSSARTGAMLRVGIVSSVGMLVATTAAAPIGATEVAAARSAVLALTMVLGLQMATKGSAVGFRHILAELRMPTVASAGIVPLAFVPIATIAPNATSRLAVCVTWALVVVATVAAVSGEHQRLVQLWGTIRNRRSYAAP